MSTQTIALVTQPTLLDFVFVLLLGAVVGLLLVLLTRSKFLQGPPGPQGPRGDTGREGSDGVDVLTRFGFCSEPVIELPCVDPDGKIKHIAAHSSCMQSVTVSRGNIREMRVFGTLVGMSTKLHFLEGERAQIFITNTPLTFCASCGLTPQDAFTKSGKLSSCVTHSDKQHATDVYMTVCGNCEASIINVVCD